ncbi:MAG: acylphosphatase [Candidatus Aminicenantes bacterium]|jgi:acylphosphatase
MKSRAHILVFGRVQGVFFRDFTQRWASSFGLSGWVKNLADGRVEICVEGDQDKIESLIGMVREGPPMSRVERLDVEWETFQDEFQDFRITW